MKKLAILLLLISDHSFAQYYLPYEDVDPPPIATQFDQFINQSEIGWAAYHYEKLSFPSIDLNKLLRKRFERGEIKISYGLALGTGMANNIEYLDKAKLEEMYYPISEPVIDSNGVSLRELIPKVPDNKFDSLSDNIVSAAQIIFVKNNKLKSTVTWAAPLTTIWAFGNCLGPTEYFTTAFNYNYDFKPGKKDKLIDLGKSNSRLRIDSLPKFKMVKQLYGRNLLESIWLGVINRTVKAFSIESNEALLPSQLTNALFIKDLALPATYDTVGTVLDVGIVQPISIYLFREIEITQHWYYDQTRNIFFSSIPYIILFAKRIKNDEYEKEASPILKLVF